MKMRKYIAIASAALVSLTACQELDTHPMGGTQDESQIVETVEAVPSRVNSSVAGMYAFLGTPNKYFGTTSNRSDDFGYPAVSLGQDLNSGDMVNIVSDYDWFSVALEYSDRNPRYANPQLRFGMFYNILYATLDVLSAIPDDATHPELMAKRGQAKALRAFAYLSLAPYFQFKYVGNEDKLAVPMMREGVDTRNNPRVTLYELYNGTDGILEDLTDAIADLEGYDRAGNKGFIDQKVAYGLRARAYLYMEEWEKAAADAAAACEGYTPYEISELKAPGFYNASDHNWMWAILLPKELIGSKLASWPSQLGSFSGNAYVPFSGIYRCINVLLYDLIPTSDVRKQWWLNADKQSSYLDGLTWRYENEDKEVVTYTGQDIVDAKIPDVKEPMPAYTNVKFGQRSGTGEPYNDGDWCMMRAEEMILIQAEATAKAGDLGEGKRILENFVKTYRDPAYVCTAADLEAFSNEVWKQRRIELWGEGFAMADVMRLGKNVVRIRPGKPTNVPEAYQFNISSDDPWLLLRFVLKETTNNKAIIDNEGGAQPKQGDGANLTNGVTD